MYDEHFSTVPTTANMEDLQVPPNWVDLLTYSRDFVLQDENPAVIPELDHDWLNPEEIQERDQRQHRQAVPVNRLPAQPPEGVPAPWAGYDGDSDEEEAPAPVDVDPDEDNNDEAIVPVDNGSEGEEEEPLAVPPANPDPPGRPQRARRANPRYFGGQFVNLAERDHRKKELAAHFDLTSSRDMMLRDLGSFLQDPTD